MGTVGEPLDPLLERWSNGDGTAFEELAPLVYAELRSIAARYRHAENRELTLQTTELVHEAFLRLSTSDRSWCRSRPQFFGLAARVIRNILVDAARRRGRQKRGEGIELVQIADDFSIAIEPGIDLEMLDLALIKLEDLDPIKAKIVELRFFGGLSVEETAEVVNLGTATVKRHWAVARAWLFREIQGELPR